MFSCGAVDVVQTPAGTSFLQDRQCYSGARDEEHIRCMWSYGKIFLARRTWNHSHQKWSCWKLFHLHHREKSKWGLLSMVLCIHHYAVLLDASTKCFLNNNKKIDFRLRDVRDLEEIFGLKKKIFLFFFELYKKVSQK